MADAKRFKLKLTIPSFQLCRSKKLSNFPGNPAPVIYRLSPVNPKALDIGYPNQPAPPPSTPEKNFRSKPRNNHQLPFPNSPDHVVYCESNFCKIGGDKGKKVKSGGRRSTTSVSSRRSNFQIDKDEESESLISCMTSFSDEFYHEALPDREISRHVISSSSSSSSTKKVQRHRFQASLDRGGSEIVATTKKSKSKSTATSMTRRTAEGKVKESMAVVKRSNDPYEDFKKSMLEMIMEMEMTEAQELEQLLQCFLTLNSRQYHGVIARAFMEIWRELFSEPGVDNSQHMAC